MLGLHYISVEMRRHRLRVRVITCAHIYSSPSDKLWPNTAVSRPLQLLAAPSGDGGAAPVLHTVSAAGTCLLLVGEWGGRRWCRNKQTKPHTLQRRRKRRWRRQLLAGINIRKDEIWYVLCNNDAVDVVDHWWRLQCEKMVTDKQVYGWMCNENLPLFLL